MGGMPMRDSEHSKLASDQAADQRRRKSVLPWLVLVPMAVLAYYPTVRQFQRVGARFHSTAVSQAKGPSVPSKANLDEQLGRFEKSCNQLTALHFRAPHREQLTAFLSQAKQLKRSAARRYEAALARGSGHALHSSLELALVVDAVEEVANALARGNGSVAQSQFIRDTKLWLPRMEVVLKQDKAILEFHSHDVGFDRRAPGDLNNLTLYSEAARQIHLSHSRLSAGDPMGAWLAMIHSHMLLGVLAMRLSPPDPK